MARTREFPIHGRTTFEASEMDISGGEFPGPLRNVSTIYKKILSKDIYEVIS